MAFLAALYVGLLFIVARYSVLPYRTPLFLSPGLMGKPQDLIEFPTRDGMTLRGWWMKHPDPKGVIIFSHGYMMNRSEPTAVAAWAFDQGYSCLLYDFPGHGRAPKAVVTLGIREQDDVRAAVKWVKSQTDAKIILWGSSMGGAASAYASVDTPVAALILNSAYASLRSASENWWYIWGGKKLQFILGPSAIFARRMGGFSLDEGNVVAALRQTSIPTLLIHGDKDPLVPLSEAQKNLEARDGIELEVSPDCSHSEPRLFFPAEYFVCMKKFLDKLERKGDQSDQGRVSSISLPLVSILSTPIFRIRTGAGLTAVHRTLKMPRVKFASSIIPMPSSSPPCRAKLQRSPEKEIGSTSTILVAWATLKALLVSSSERGFRATMSRVRAATSAHRIPLIPALSK